MQNNDRIKHIDSAKGLLIIFVVLGHMLLMDHAPKSATYINAFIYSFHMPAFFMISGAMFNEIKWHRYGFIAFIKSRFHSLIIPWAFFEIQAVLLKTTLTLFKEEGLSLRSIAHVVKPILLNANPFNLWTNYGANWFLITLFCGEIILFLLSRLDVRKFLLSAVVFLTFAIIIKHRYIDITSCKWIGRVLLASLFLETGFYFRRFVKSPSIALAVPSLCLVLFCSCINGFIDMCPYRFTYIAIFYVSGIAGAFFILGLAQYVQNKMLDKIGKESLTIMGTHLLVRYLFTGIYPELWRFTFLHACIFMVSVCILSVGYIALINRLCPCLVGKRHRGQ